MPTITRTRNVAVFSAAALAIGTLAGCSASDPLATGNEAGDGTAITVASANFPENVILGEIYAQALEASGFDVDRKLNIGAREVYFSQIENCELSVVPEYNQALLAFIAPDVAAAGTAAIDQALSAALPDGVGVLSSSSAEDNNAVVVPEQLAEEYGISSVADFAGISHEWVFGGPPEWKERGDGFLGLTEAYGFEFAEYRVLDYSGPITLSALDKGDIQAALLFSTTPQIATNNLRVLEDPELVMGVNNVIPLYCESALDDEAISVLESISQALTTDGLTDLNAAYSIDKQDADRVARDWLTAEGLL